MPGRRCRRCRHFLHSAAASIRKQWLLQAIDQVPNRTSFVEVQS